MCMNSSLKIRHAGQQDLAAIDDIYNYYITDTAFTFDIEPYTQEQRQAWFDGLSPDGPHQCFVARSQDQVVGVAYSAPFRVKAAYDTSVEVSVYLSPEAGGQGLGTKLYTYLFDALKSKDVHRAYAGITQPNMASEALHRLFGFTEIGTYREVGRKFGKYWDVKWFEKAL